MQQGISATVQCMLEWEVKAYGLMIRFWRVMSTLSAIVAVDDNHYRQAVMVCVHVNHFTACPNIVATSRPLGIFITYNHFVFNTVSAFIITRIYESCTFRLSNYSAY